MKYNKLFALLMAGAALAASSCQKEQEPEDQGKKPQTGEFTYGFRPSTARCKSRLCAAAGRQYHESG